MPTDIRNAIMNLMARSDLFTSEINALKNDTNTYTFGYNSQQAQNADIQSPGGTVQPNGQDAYSIQVSSNDNQDQMEADLAHEVSHASDIANNVFTTFDVTIAGTVPENNEKNTYEEAHGYLLENEILNQAFGQRRRSPLSSSNFRTGVVLNSRPGRPN